jgi:hypothetical protein
MERSRKDGVGKVSMLLEREAHTRDMMFPPAQSSFNSHLYIYISTCMHIICPLLRVIVTGKYIYVYIMLTIVYVCMKRGIISIMCTGKISILIHHS